jgi:MerR family transcriptional regulator, light-induced transcriptional regulator
MADFATRLRELRKDRGLRQVDLAGEMGVAQTTIANYEQHTRFPDEDTLRKIANYFDVSLDFLLGRSHTSLRGGNNGASTVREVSMATLSPLAESYVKQLLGGDRTRAYQTILGAARDGASVRALYADVLQPALQAVGRLWETAEIDVATEHYFSEATESLMSLLYPYLQQPKHDRGVVVSVGVNGEFHHIGVKMISDILGEEGWKCFYLGTNTPTASLVQALDERKADILAISATMPFNVDTVATTIKHVRSTSQRANLKIITGGQAFNRDSSLWKDVGADGYARDLSETIQKVNLLGSSMS